jgi:hypothetical protein
MQGCSGLLDCAYVHIHAHQVGFPTHGHHPSLPRCLFASCFWDVLSLLLVCGGSFPSPACSIKAVQVLAGAALSHLSHQGSWLASASTLRAHTHTHTPKTNHWSERGARYAACYRVWRHTRVCAHLRAMCTIMQWACLHQLHMHLLTVLYLCLRCGHYQGAPEHQLYHHDASAQPLHVLSQG